MFRHGDVLVLDPIPEPADAAIRGGDVVMEGEVTGHAHRLRGGDVLTGHGRFACLLRCLAGATLTHEEHKTVELPKTADGMVYPVIIQREYDDENEWRQVAD